MLKLIQSSQGLGLPNPSPGCMEMETWLRMTKIPYEVGALDMAAAPKGKIPYIVEDDGTKLGDTSFIIEHLKKTRGVDPDAHMSKRELAIAHTVRRMMKEHFYWFVAVNRYTYEENWDTYKRMLAPEWTPPGLTEEQQFAVLEEVRKMIRGQMHASGVGRHPPQDALALAIADMDAVVAVLDGKPFLGGEKPCSADAALYAYLANVIDVQGMMAPIKEYGLKQKPLVSYCARMRNLYWPGFEGAAPE